MMLTGVVTSPKSSMSDARADLLEAAVAALNANLANHAELVKGLNNNQKPTPASVSTPRVR